MKIRVARAAFATMLAVAVAGCAETPPDGHEREADPVAQPVRRPEWGREILRLHAKGVQTYRVENDREGKLAWKFVGPRADLFDDASRMVGTHFLGETGPVWELGAARVTGKKLRERPSPNAGAIPELQLGATVTAGGDLAGVTFVERLDTTGGAAPALDASRHAGEMIEVPYTADYVFYTATR